MLLVAAVLFVAGLNLESGEPLMMAAGLVLSAAATVLVLVVRRPLTDAAVAVFALVFGVLDLAEALHGLREDETTVGILALIIGVLHLGAAWLTSDLARSPGQENRRQDAWPSDSQL